MSLSDRRTFLTLVAGLPLLAACGFSPVYAPGSAGLAVRGRIRAADPTDRNGFAFVRELETRLGVPEAPEYTLAYTITTNQVGVAYSTDNAITRYNVVGKVVWSVSRGDTRLTGGTAQSFTSWSATGSTVAGLTAEADASERLMRILADQIATQITATAPGWTK